MQKLAERIDLVIVPTEREGGQFHDEVVKPRGRTWKIDPSRFNPGRLRDKALHLGTFGLDRNRAKVRLHPKLLDQGCCGPSVFDQDGLGIVLLLKFKHPTL